MSLNSAGTTRELPPLMLPLPISTTAAGLGNCGSLDEPSTPKTENSILKPPLVCPPAPKKTRPARRKPLANLMPNRFHPAPEDLSSVFIKLPTAGRPKKRIRLV
ncbi:hypothetical protein HPP92_017133 [Vanilla planifolia]|uniref:Uncharacterized protein n=1 Tax=Vanilla planifolia TaxID=51239 RepID=A0A835QKP3_VANPL|nr:hypothetical protein HPP92_017133 [Vanilla planifolia]